MTPKCQSCRIADGVVYIDFGTRLYCGFCYLAWTLELKRPVPYMDTERKIRRVRSAA